MFPQHLPIFSVPLFDSRDERHPAFVFDVVPARWDCLTTFDDAVLTMVGEFWAFGRGGEWFDRENRAMSIASNGLQHPDFTIEPGGAMLHTSTPLAPACPVVGNADTVTLPNGDVFAADVFGNGHLYHNPRFSQEKKNLDLFLQGADGAFAHAARSAALGVSLATIAEGSAYHPMGTHDTIAVVADLLARSLACVTASGQQGVQKLNTEMWDFQRYLLRSWIVRPDQGWHATRWLPGREWDACVAAADPIVLDAARAATAFVLDSRHPAQLFVSSDRTPLTGHHKLAVKGERHALERTVLHALAPIAHALKPKAAAAVRALNT